MDPEVRVSVAYNAADIDPSADLPCVIGEQVRIDHKRLQTFCFRELPEVGIDLVALVGAVSFADRSIRRRVSTGWGRSIHISLPVFDLERWQQPEIRRRLISVLHYVSGDDWTFDFIPAGRVPDLLRQPPLELNFDPSVSLVMPYSDGLDSFAHKQLVKKDGAIPILVTASSRGIVKPSRKMRAKELQALVPVTLSGLKNAEPSYRTRTFLFKTLAALAAYLADVRHVVIPENGQGGIGPSLVPFLSEWPHRSSHPAFTARLSKFLECLLNTSIEFDHPNRFLTKGEVLRRLANENVLGNWSDDTRSCVRDSRYSHMDGQRVHCGVCSGCLLRRSSIYAADLDPSSEIYRWPNLNARRLEEALNPHASGRPTGKNDHDIAAHAVLGMHALATLSAEGELSPAVRMAALDLAGDDLSQFSGNLAGLSRLLSAHCREWMAFVNATGEGSWLRSLVSNDEHA